MTSAIWRSSLYVVVEGPNWDDAQLNAEVAEPERDLVLQYAGSEYLLTAEYGTFLSLSSILRDDPWWFENQDTSAGIQGPDELARKVAINVGREWFEVSNDLSYDRYYSIYGGGKNLPVFTALVRENDSNSTVGVEWDTGSGYAVGDRARVDVEHYYLNATLIGDIGSFRAGEEDKVFHVNSRPDAGPSLAGDHSSGQLVAIDTSTIVDLDIVNREGISWDFSWQMLFVEEWMPPEFGSWVNLESLDALDGDNLLRLEQVNVGSTFRGVVSFVDDFSTTETVFTESFVVRQGSVDPLTGILDMPGKVNLKNKGVTPFTLYGSNEIDVTQIDLQSLRFGNEPDELVNPSTKKNGSIFADLEDVNQDGIMDMTVKVSTSSLASIISKGTTDIHAFGQYGDGTELVFGLGAGDSVLFF